MTVEIISWSISSKVWDRAGIEFATPGSAVRLTSVVRNVTDCVTRKRLIFLCHEAGTVYSTAKNFPAPWLHESLTWVASVHDNYALITEPRVNSPLNQVSERLNIKTMQAIRNLLCVDNQVEMWSARNTPHLQRKSSIDCLWWHDRNSLFGKMMSNLRHEPPSYDMKPQQIKQSCNFPAPSLGIKPKSHRYKTICFNKWAKECNLI